MASDKELLNPAWQKAGIAVVTDVYNLALLQENFELQVSLNFPGRLCFNEKQNYKYKHIN